MTSSPLPISIKVGYRDISVFAIEDTSILEGDADYDALTGAIRIRSDAPTQYMAELMLHELGHAIWDMAGLPEVATEETVASNFAKLQAQIWRDNPDFVAFISGALK